MFSRSSRAVILCAQLWTYATQYSEMYDDMTVADMQSKVRGLLAEFFTPEEIEAARSLMCNLPAVGNEERAAEDIGMTVYHSIDEVQLWT